MIKLNFKYIVIAIILLFVEIFIAIYIHDKFIRPNVGDFLVVILLYCLIMGFLNSKVFSTALFVLFFAYLVELLQYLDVVHFLGLETNQIAQIVIGSTFSWIDIVCYTLGILFVLILERKFPFHKNVNICL